MERLTVLYDEHCAICRRCRDWLAGQRTHVELELLAAGSPAAKQRYGSVPWLGQELVVVNDLGSVWMGPAAFITCLWATVRYREWSYRLSGPTLAPMAEGFFRAITKRRLRWSVYLSEGAEPECTWCERPSFGSEPPPLPSIDHVSQPG